MCKICGNPTRSSHGVCNRTPTCKREANRLRAIVWRAKNPDKESAKGKRYREKNREYWNIKSQLWREDNKERAAATGRAWRQANLDRMAAKEHRRRSRRYSVPYLKADPPYALLMFLQKDSCSLCGLPLDDTSTVDHIVPISLGGWDVPGNLAIAHKSCNSSKGNRVDLDSYVCKEAQRRAELFAARCPELVTFP